MSYISNSTSFDGNLLESVPGLTVLSTNPYVPARRKLTIADIARSNKSKLVSAFYTSKPILVKVGITRATRALVEQSLDSLMGIIQGEEKNLLVPQSGSVRRYTATFNPSTMTVSGGSYIELDLIFETSDHFGYESATSTLAQVNAFTSSYKTTQITVAGSAPWQVPITTVTFTTITGGTGATVRLGNDSTGQVATVTRDWVSGDVLVFNAFTQSVTVNGVEVAFGGALPEWQSGTQYVTLSDTFTTRTYGMNMIYNKRYV